MKNNRSEQSDQGHEDRLGQILRAGFVRPLDPSDGNAFTNQVMSRIESLTPELIVPGFSWALPAVLVCLLAVTTAVGLVYEEKTESPNIDDVLLANVPAETQNMLGHSPSFSNILWNPAQGGFLP